MAKSWDELTVDEQIELLRQDIQKIGMRQNGFELRLSDLAGEVLELKKKAKEG